MPPWDKYQNTEAAPAGPWSKYSPPAAPAQEKTLMQAAFPGANADRAPKEVLQPWGNIPGQKPITRTMGPREQAIGPAIMDALSLPSRAAGTAGAAMGYEGATGGRHGLEALADPETGLMRPARQAMGRSMAESVAGMKDPRKDWAERAGHAVGAGIAGAGYVAASAVEDPATWIPGVGMAAKTQTAGKVFKAAEKVSNLPNKAAGKLAQELSSVSEEALRMASTKEGRAALKANAGKEYEIGQRLVQMMDNPKEFAPNKVKIDNALTGMGDVDLMPVIKALQDAKVKRPSGRLWDHEKAANDAIQKDINALLGQGGKTKASAAEALDLRRGMDDVIDHSGDQKQLAIANNARLKGRKAMRDLLEQKASVSGNPEYIEAMKSLHKQFDARDRLARFLGKNSDAREDRAEGFISNMWGKNKKNRERVMSDFGEAFGKDFLEESKLANLAAQLGPEGSPTWFSRATTGRSKLAGAVGMPFGGSPKIATRVTLPLLELPAKGFQWLQKLSQAKSPGEAAFYTANLKKLGLDDGSIGEGVAAIEPPKPPPSAPSAMAVPETGPTAPAAPAKKTIEFSPQEAFNRRIAAIKYLRETTGDVPAQGELYKFLNDLGEGPVPKAPPKPAPVSREFNGRRPKQDIEFLASAIKGGTPGYPTKTVPVKEAPESFTLHGTEFKRVKSKWDNVITYKDAQGQKHEFRGNEVIHMDPEESPVPF